MKKIDFFLVPVSVHSIKSKKHEQFRRFKNKQPLLCAHLGWIKLRKLTRKPQSRRSQERKSGFWSGGRVNSFSLFGLKEPDLPILLTGPGCPCAYLMHSSVVHCVFMVEDGYVRGIGYGFCSQTSNNEMEEQTEMWTQSTQTCILPKWVHVIISDFLCFKSNSLFYTCLDLSAGLLLSPYLFR